MTAHNIQPDRFFASTVFAMTLLVVLVIWVFSFPDPDLQPYPPYTPFEIVLRILCLVVAWPVGVVAAIGGDGAAFFLFFPLWVLTGLFWAFVVEWIFRLKTRKN